VEDDVVGNDQRSGNNESRIASTISAAALGALVGFGTQFFLFDGGLWFPGDIVLAFALVCGTLGFFLGEQFIEWMRENWWWFW
jgi:hypothetical protein